MFIKISAILLLCLVKNQTDAYKILCVHPVPTYSHYALVTPLLQQLSERGHQVTSISSFPLKSKPLKNFRHIALLEQSKFFAALDLPTLNSQQLRDTLVWEIFAAMYKISPSLVKSVMEDHAVQKLLSDPRETFDLVIFDLPFFDALFGIAAHFGASLVGVAPFGAHSWYTDLTGAPTLPSIMAFKHLGYDDSMTFLERLNNFHYYFFEYLFVRFMYLPRHEKLFEQYFGQTGYTLADVRRNFSLVLLNQHSSLGFSRPFMPNMIEVGGMHINSSQISPLPVKIQKFLDEATEGAIYFALGSNVNSAKLSPLMLNAIINTFQVLPQRILWKIEGSNLPDMPANVLISSWFPQTDVLAHPNIKLFISHAGLLSTTESAVFGKPLLGIPFFGDQFMNIARVKTLGYGLMLDVNEFSESKFLQIIQELLSNSSYSQMAKIISKRYHDKPQTALETAIFWVEYVLRHQGAAHMRSDSLNLNILQYYGLDVIALMLVEVLLLVWMIITLLRKCYAVVCRIGWLQRQTKLKIK